MSLYVNIPPTSGSVSPWQLAQQSFLSSLGLGLNTFIPLKVGIASMGQALSGTNDGASEGGARTGTSGASTAFGTSFYQTPNTSKWGCAIRAKLAVPVGGRVAVIGIENSAGTHDIFVGSQFASDATHYILECDGTSSTVDITTVTVTATYRTFVLSGDTANVRLYIDGTLAATRAIGTNVVDEPNYPFLFNTIAGDCIVSDFLIGCVIP